jgi:hypothetical protein
MREAQGRSTVRGISTTGNFTSVKFCLEPEQLVSDLP